MDRVCWRAGGARRRLRDRPARPCPERGAVTAETAVVIPLLVVLSLGLAWAVGLAVAQVRVVDAARETARAVARDEGRGAAVALGERVAPDGTRITVASEGALVRVRAVTTVSGPGGLFDFLPGVQVDAEAVTAKEPG